MPVIIVLYDIFKSSISTKLLPTTTSTIIITSGSSLKLLIIIIVSVCLLTKKRWVVKFNDVYPHFGFTKI